MSTVMTVTGPASPQSLGITMAHEHLLIDLTCLLDPPPTAVAARPGRDPSSASQPCGLLYCDPYVSRPNLLLDEPDAAEEELRLYRALGGGSIVDLTVHGIGPRPDALRALSLATGVPIVMGCGFYVHRAHPSYVGAMSPADVERFLLREIVEGVDGSDVLPGIILRSIVPELERRGVPASIVSTLLVLNPARVLTAAQ